LALESAEKTAFYDVSAAKIRPTPTPEVPFVVGGRSNAALRRTALLGDGWLATWCSPRRFAEAVELVSQTATEAGRGDVSWQHGLQVWLGVGDTADEGRAHVSKAMERFYQIPFEPFAKYTPCGTPAEIADALRPYVDAGATTLNLTPVGRDSAVELEAVAAIRAELLS